MVRTVSLDSKESKWFVISVEEEQLVWSGLYDAKDKNHLCHVCFQTKKTWSLSALLASVVYYSSRALSWYLKSLCLLRAVLLLSAANVHCCK